MKLFYVAFSRQSPNHPWEYAAHDTKPLRIFGCIIGHTNDTDFFMQILTDDLTSLLPK
jgi:hypothetical protein